MIDVNSTHDHFSNEPLKCNYRSVHDPKTIKSNFWSPKYFPPLRGVILNCRHGAWREKGNFTASHPLRSASLRHAQLTHPYSAGTRIHPYLESVREDSMTLKWQERSMQPTRASIEILSSSPVFWNNGQNVVSPAKKAEADKQRDGDHRHNPMRVGVKGILRP